MSADVRAADLAGARKRNLSDDVPAPQLPTATDRVPDGDLWFHEIKFDGYRMLGHFRAGKVRCISRNGRDWTEKVRPIAYAVSKLDAGELLLDGEVAVADARGITDFQALQNLIGAQRQPGLLYYVFDVLYADGHDLISVTLEERKRYLSGLFSDVSEGSPLRLSEHLVGNGPLVLSNACQLGVEGIVSKRRDKGYHSGRQSGWLKAKCKLRDSFAIVGYTLSDKQHRPIRALILADVTPKGFQYCGRVGTGFSDQTLKELHSVLDSSRTEKCPFEEWPESVPRKEAVWTSQPLIAEVEFANRSSSGTLRHPSFKGLRLDIDLDDLITL